MVAIELYNDVFGPVILGLIPVIIYVIALFFRGGYKAIVLTCVIAVIECFYTIPDKPGMVFFNIFMCILFMCIWFNNYKANHKDNGPGAYRDLFNDDMDGDGIKDDFQGYGWARSKWAMWFTKSKKAKGQDEPTLKDYARFADFAGANAYKNYNFKGGTGKAKFEQKRENVHYNRDYGDTSWDYKNESNFSDNTNSQMLHARAKTYNLKYFAKCQDVKEARSLYHKYAAKFHPDNTVTGDKEKFIAIDQEYNRFCELFE